MSDKKIKLPDFIIADFYKHALVELEDNTERPEAEFQQTTVLAEEESSKKIKYLGDNAKKVIVIVSEEKAVFVNEADLTFLTNILKACQLSLADIAIVNIAGQEITFSQIKEQLNAVNIMLFQVEPNMIKLPFKIPAFQLQNYAGCTIMVAPALGLLNQPSNEGRLLKTKLWNSLKQVFGIN